MDAYDVVRAKRFELVDDQGNTRAYMDSAEDGLMGIFFTDQQRESYISIGIGKDDAPYILMQRSPAESTAIAISIGEQEGVSTPFVQLKGQSGVEVKLAITKDGSTALSLTSGEETSALLSASEQGLAGLLLRNQDGKESAFAPEPRPQF